MPNAGSRIPVPLVCQWCERTIPAKAAELWDDRPQCKNLNACDRAADRRAKARAPVTPAEELRAAADAVLAGRDPDDDQVNSAARWAHLLRAEAELPIPSATALAVARVLNTVRQREAA